MRTRGGPGQRAQAYSPKKHAMGCDAEGGLVRKGAQVGCQQKSAIGLLPIEGGTVGPVAMLTKSDDRVCKRGL